MTSMDQAFRNYVSLCEAFVGKELDPSKCPDFTLDKSLHNHLVTSLQKRKCFYKQFVYPFKPPQDRKSQD